MNILDLAQGVKLHDHAIEDIAVDYKNGQITVQLLTPDLKPLELQIEDFSEFFIQNHAPWGRGHYISWSDLQPIDGNHYQLDLELNSGDRIRIVFSGSQQ
ncbi:hypothetical protein [Pseudoflavonifractor sp. 60]|uniref:hypothetical protein n=1 Tax=Pseudoflavonifractor sp. 60 TaxID=2304576 RepID=UPI00136EA0D6|nr:hypothetical protein [Pseudoflavonifractor sp. 60]